MQKEIAINILREVISSDSSNITSEDKELCLNFLNEIEKDSTDDFLKKLLSMAKIAEILHEIFGT